MRWENVLGELPESSIARDFNQNLRFIGTARPEHGTMFQCGEGGMRIRALAFAACLALTGCAAAEQISLRDAVEEPSFREPGETATIWNNTNSAHPTPGLRRRPQNGNRVDTAKTLHQKPSQKASNQRLVSYEEPVPELPLDATSREALFRKFLQWRQRQLRLR
jgi:hypothetical protein